MGQVEEGPGDEGGQAEQWHGWLLDTRLGKQGSSCSGSRPLTTRLNHSGSFFNGEWHLERPAASMKSVTESRKVQSLSSGQPYGKSDGRSLALPIWALVGGSARRLWPRCGTRLPGFTSLLPHRF